jgi:outer membrane protein assembly factor BamB
MDPAGQVLWRSGTEHRFGLGPFMVADGKLLVLGDDGELSLAQATPRGYAPLARADVLSGLEAWAPMALAAGRLLVRDRNRMVCLAMGAEKL